MNHKQFFTALFTLFISLFTVSSCDDGGGENNNNLTVDQDVKGWCAEWLYCTGDPEDYIDIPWETQEECEEIVQYIKKHQDDSELSGSCHFALMRAAVIGCYSINEEWKAEESCSYTPYGVCEGVDPYNEDCVE